MAEDIARFPLQNGRCDFEIGLKAGNDVFKRVVAVAVRMGVIVEMIVVVIAVAVLIGLIVGHAAPR